MAKPKKNNLGEEPGIVVETPQVAQGSGVVEYPALSKNYRDNPEELAGLFSRLNALKPGETEQTPDAGGNVLSRDAVTEGLDFNVFLDEEQRKGTQWDPLSGVKLDDLFRYEQPVKSTFPTTTPSFVSGEEGEVGEEEELTPLVSSDPTYEEVEAPVEAIEETTPISSVDYAGVTHGDFTNEDWNKLWHGTLAPALTEIGGGVGTSLVTLPLLLGSGPVGWGTFLARLTTYVTINFWAGYNLNVKAQRMRMPTKGGAVTEVNQAEAYASGVMQSIPWLVPLRYTKNASGWKLAGFGAAEGAGYGAGHDAIMQLLQIQAGDQESYDLTQTLFATGIGAGIGGGIGKLADMIGIKVNPEAPRREQLQTIAKHQVSEAKDLLKYVKEVDGDPAVIAAAERRLVKAKDNLKRVKSFTEDHYKAAIKEIENLMDAQDSVIYNQVRANLGLDYQRGYGEQIKKAEGDFEFLGQRGFVADPNRTSKIEATGISEFGGEMGQVDRGWKLGKGKNVTEVYPGKYPFTQNKDGTYSNVLLNVFEIEGQFYVLPTMRDGKKLSDEDAIKLAVDAMENPLPGEGYPEWLRKVRFETKEHAEIWRQENLGHIDADGKNVINFGDKAKKYRNQLEFETDGKKKYRGAEAKEVTVTGEVTVYAAREDGNIVIKKRGEEALPETEAVAAKPKEEGEEAPIPVVKDPVAREPIPITDDEIDDVLDDFLAGVGERPQAVDPETGALVTADKADVPKARLLTGDEDAQRMINLIADRLKERLAKGTMTKESLSAASQKYFLEIFGEDDLNKVLAAEGAAARAGNVSAALADAMERHVLEIYSLGAYLGKHYEDVASLAKHLDMDNPLSMAEFKQRLLSGLPIFLDYQRASTAWGRQGKAMQFTEKGVLEGYEAASVGAEAKLVDDLLSTDLSKISQDDLTEFLNQHNDLQGWRLLVSLLKEQKDGDLKAVHKLLTNQLKAFQNQSTLSKMMTTGKSYYSRMEAMGVDVIYSNFLSSSPTMFRVVVGNFVMSRLLPRWSMVGARVQQGYAKLFGGDTETAKATYDFYRRLLKHQNIYSQLALQEAKRVLGNGEPSDLAKLSAAFNDISAGAGAFGESNIGTMDSAFQQTFENLGRYFNVFGNTMNAIDSRSRQRYAHSFVLAQAMEDFDKIPPAERGNFSEYYEKYVNRLIEDSGEIPAAKRTITLPKEAGGEKVVIPVGRWKDENSVRKEAMEMAAERGLMGEELANFVEAYVEKAWTPQHSQLVEHVQRHLKEMTFTEELGEFHKKINADGKEVPDSNFIENLMVKIEKLGNEPVLRLFKALYAPFMRTGRNVMRETAATTSLAAHIPWFGQLYRKTLSDLNSANPKIRATARGRQIVGAAVLVIAWTASRMDWYLGPKERDKYRKRARERGEGQGNNYGIPFKIFGTEGIIDLSALEPYVGIFNIMADFNHIMENSEDVDPGVLDKVEHVAYALRVAIMGDYFNKSYNKGLAEVLGNVNEKLPEHLKKYQEMHGPFLSLDSEKKWFKQTLRGLFVSSGENQMVRSLDPLVRQGQQALHSLARSMSDLYWMVPPQLDRMGGLQYTDPHYTGKKANEIAGWNQSAVQALMSGQPFKVKFGKVPINKWMSKDEGGKDVLKLSSTNETTGEVENLVDFDNPDEVNSAVFAIFLHTKFTGEFPKPDEHDSYSTAGEFDLRKIYAEFPEVKDRLGWKMGKTQNAYWRWKRVAGVFNFIEGYGAPVKDKRGKTTNLATYVDPLSGKEKKMKVNKALHGLNVKQAIIKVFQHPGLKLLEGLEDPTYEDLGGRKFDDPRHQLINDVLNLYRFAAFWDMAKHYPIIGENVKWHVEVAEKAKKLKTREALEAITSPEDSPFKAYMKREDRPKDPLPEALKNRNIFFHLLDMGEDR